MKTTLERLRAEADTTLRHAQDTAIDLYNLEDLAYTIDEIRKVIGDEGTLSVHTNRWCPSGVTLGYYLQAGEGFKGGKVEEVINHCLELDYESIDEYVCEIIQYKEWRFFMKGTARATMIIVRFYYGESDKCKMVETGEIEEVALKELVCE